jgi:hypothetical protein
MVPISKTFRSLAVSRNTVLQMETAAMFKYIEFLTQQYTAIEEVVGYGDELFERLEASEASEGFHVLYQMLNVRDLRHANSDIIHNYHPQSTKTSSLNPE